MNKKPPELHLIDGTKPRTTNPVALPQKIRQRIPKAEWLDNYDAWDKNKFIEETSEFLLEVYGIGNKQDKTALAMLANEVDTYVTCCKAIDKGGVVWRFNNGANHGSSPYLIERGKAFKNIIQMMNELGLTPRGRLSIMKPEEDSAVAKFLKGPLAQ
jgi:P27 family predicted phage terminase small subunit